MMPIVLGDLAWQTTFPHRVAPLPDEWLTGLLLRCDEVNHWESGETFRYLLHSTDHPGFGPDASLLVVPFSLLECLAQFLMVSPKRLLATTYSAELARLYPSDEPHPKFLLGPQYHSEKRLRRFRRGQRELSRKRPIHLCPVCVAQTRIIKRTEALPHLHYCPIHHVAFQGRCSCGTPLSFFSRGTPPFACSGCGLDWGEFPHISISPDRLKLEKLIGCIEIVFQLQSIWGNRNVREFAPIQTTPRAGKWWRPTREEGEGCSAGTTPLERDMVDRAIVQMWQCLSAFDNTCLSNTYRAKMDWALPAEFSLSTPESS